MADIQAALNELMVPSPRPESTIVRVIDRSADRPEDRAAWHKKAQQARYNWAKRVDPISVMAFEIALAAITNRGRNHA